MNLSDERSQQNRTHNAAQARTLDTLDMDIKVSVIMAGYNAERYVDEALATVVSQSLRDIEIIFVDDGSTDGTLGIVEKYAHDDARIRVLACAHEGAGAARNKGLEAARGEYLSFLDADDIFDSQMLEKSYALAKEKQADIVVFKYRDKDLATGKIRPNIGFSLPPAYIGKNAAVGVKGLSWSNPTAWNKIFRREFVQKYNLRFQNVATCNDFAFTKSAIIAANRLFFLNEELLTYCKNPHNTTSTRYQHAHCIIDAGQEILAFIRKHCPAQDIKPFYRMMENHFRYEYNCFPNRRDGKEFLRQCEAFLPLRHRLHFIWGRHRRLLKEHLRHFRKSIKAFFKGQK